MTSTGTLSHPPLTGPPIPSNVPALAEIIRPFGITGRGISFAGEDGNAGRTLTYHELAGCAAAAAIRLRRCGAGPGEKVALTLTNDLTSVLAVLGTWAVGATVVSLPPRRRRPGNSHPSKLAQILDGIGCRFLIAGGDPLSGEQAGAGLRTVPKQALAEPGQVRERSPGADAPGTALIQFTSGSIGTPKGVAISSGALARHLAGLSSSLACDGETDRIVSWLPLYHDMGLIVMFLLGLAARADQVLGQPSAFAAQPAGWLTMLARERATMTAAPDFAYRLAAAVPYPERLDLSRVRVCVSGGERLSWQTMLDFQATAEPMGLRWEAICPGYGLAEATVAVTHTPLGRGPLGGPAGHVSVGRPVPGVRVQAPAGPVPGPISVRSEALFDGYHTTDGFLPVAANQWFDTGDDGFLHDGELYVVGRRDEVLAMAGRNVFAEDLESAVQEACGQRIRACAAFRNAAADRFGLVAEASPRAVTGPDSARELAVRMQAAVVGAVGTRPTPVLVVRTGVIPRTSSGKVQRAQFRSLYYRGEFGKRLLAELA